MARDWRKNVDPIIREHLESQIKSTLSYKKAYEEADNKSTAQLWIAVANLSKQQFNNSMKLNYIEDLMKDVVKKIDEIKDKKEEISFMEEPKIEIFETKEEVLMPKKLTVKKAVKKASVKKLPAKKTAKKVVKKKVAKKTAKKANVRKTLKRF